MHAPIDIKDYLERSKYSSEEIASFCKMTFNFMTAPMSNGEVSLEDIVVYVTSVSDGKYGLIGKNFAENVKVLYNLGTPYYNAVEFLGSPKKRCFNVKIVKRVQRSYTQDERRIRRMKSIDLFFRLTRGLSIHSVFKIANNENASPRDRIPRYILHYLRLHVKDGCSQVSEILGGEWIEALTERWLKAIKGKPMPFGMEHRLSHGILGCEMLLAYTWIRKEDLVDPENENAVKYLEIMKSQAEKGPCWEDHPSLRPFSLFNGEMNLSEICNFFLATQVKQEKMKELVAYEALNSIPIANEEYNNWEIVTEEMYSYRQTPFKL